ncbi:unnamed protein product [Urochloa humidicola]
MWEHDRFPRKPLPSLIFVPPPLPNPAARATPPDSARRRRPSSPASLARLAPPPPLSTCAPALCRLTAKRHRRSLGPFAARSYCPTATPLLRVAAGFAEAPVRIWGGVERRGIVTQTDGLTTTVTECYFGGNGSPFQWYFTGRQSFSAIFRF